MDIIKVFKNLSILGRMNCNLSIVLLIHFDISVYLNLTLHLLFYVKFTEAKHYHAKLVNIRKEMLMLHEKTSKLKVSWKFFHILCKSRDLIVHFSLGFIFWLLIFPFKITYLVHGTLFSFKHTFLSLLCAFY